MTELSEQQERDAGKAWRRPSWWHALMVLPFLMGVVFLLYESVLYRNTVKRQHTTFGTVTAQEANHDQYRYTFTVEGRRYDGRQIPRDSEKWTMGQQVVVYYDAADPSRNSLEDFTAESYFIIGPIPTLIFGFVILLWAIKSLRRSPL